MTAKAAFLAEVLRHGGHVGGTTTRLLHWATTRAGLWDEHKAMISPPWIGTLDKTVSAA